MMIRILLIAGLLATGTSANVWAQPQARPEETGNAKQRLQKIQQQIEKHRDRQRTLERESNTLAAQVKQIRHNIIELASLMRAHDEKLHSVESNLADLEHTKNTIAKRLAAEQAQLSQSLAGLQMLEQNPPPAFVTHPDNVMAMIRGGTLMAGLVPIMRARADAVRENLVALREVRGKIVRQREVLTLRQDAARGDRNKLNALLQHKEQEEHSLRAEARTEAEQIRALARAANNLEDFMGRLSRRKGAITGGNFARAKGKLALPVAGSVASSTRKTETDILNAGLTIMARAGAQVTAPYDGTVLYAGPFRQYGNILILGVGNGYHLLFAGLGLMTSFVGQEILAGEPLGQMPQQEVARLYMEIRYRGKTIDPKGWVLARQ